MVRIYYYRKSSNFKCELFEFLNSLPKTVRKKKDKKKKVKKLKFVMEKVKNNIMKRRKSL